MHFRIGKWNTTAKQKRENTEGTTWNSNNPDSREVALQNQIEDLEAKDKRIRDLDINARLKTQVDRLTMTLAAARAYGSTYPSNGRNEGIFNTARSIHDLSAKVPRTDYYEMILEEPNSRERYTDLATAAIGEEL